MIIGYRGGPMVFTGRKTNATQWCRWASRIDGAAIQEKPSGLGDIARRQLRGTPDEVGVEGLQVFAAFAGDEM